MGWAGRSGDDVKRSPVAAWLTIVAGLAIALGLVSPTVRAAIGASIPAGSIVAANVLFYALLFLPLVVLAAALGVIDRRPVFRRGRRPLRWGTVGLVTGIGGVAMCVLYVWLNGSLRAAPSDPMPPAYLAVGLALAMLGVVAEELLFRGWLLPALVEMIAFWPAVLLSAAAFSAFHLWAGGAKDAISLVNLMLGGIWFALLACRSGGLIAPIAAHFGWNVAEDLGFGLIPNPGRGDFGALLDRDVCGPAWWGGSDEGLNASVAMTIVLLALILPLLASPQRSA